MSFDKEAFEERAAIMEFDGGMTRFRAETMAAKEQGISRWEAIGDVAKRVVEKAWGQCSEVDRQGSADNVPGVQPGAAQEERPMPKRVGG